MTDIKAVEVTEAERRVYQGIQDSPEIFQRHLRPAQIAAHFNMTWGEFQEAFGGLIRKGLVEQGKIYAPPGRIQ